METIEMLQLPITDNWTFREATATASYPAQVPGCVHTDLMRNNLIPDPFFGTNEQKLQWIGEKDWVYQTTFDLPPRILKQQNVELDFRGLDTYATVTLNGSEILGANNMFREWRVACKQLLARKGNTLEIRFRNVFDQTLPKYHSAPYRLQAFATNDQSDVKLSMYSRKAQFHFGWDWGPRLVTCGIWRPILIEAWTGARLQSVFVKQEDVTAESARIASIVEILSDSAQSARITIEMDKLALTSAEVSLQPGRNVFTIEGRLERPILWWTNGLGVQHLYNYVARVETNTGASDEYSTRIGVRSLEVIREKDASGTPLYVRLNGVPVFMKGANYIPQDNFQSRVTKERYEWILGSAAEAHMNMLRVWGGGIFEEDLFFDLCDEHGILVWHDLQFACAMYPADETFLANVRQEVVDNVTRLRNHPCIALYCGNNENEFAWYESGWKKLYPPETQAAQEGDIRALYYETIPQALRETDPTRYYHPTSPNAGLNGIAYADGDIHYWGVWHGKEPFENYPAHIARFVSEYGFQSYPELATVKQFTDPSDRELHSPAMLSHQRCTSDERRDQEYGNRLIQSYRDRWYRKPKDFESYLYVSQVMQADGVRLGMEAHRRAMPFCMGSLYWQIDDCWPVASWSSIDYFGRWKALHYIARDRFAPVIVFMRTNGDQLEFHAVSDRHDAVDAVLDIRALDFEGRRISGRTVPVRINANSAQTCFQVPRSKLERKHDDRRMVVVARLRQGRRTIADNLACLRLPKDLELTSPDLALRVEKSRIGCRVSVSAKCFARAVMLSCGTDNGHFSDNYFDLLPGREKRVEYETKLDEQSVTDQLKAVSLFDSYES